MHRFTAAVPPSVEDAHKTWCAILFWGRSVWFPWRQNSGNTPGPFRIGVLLSCHLYLHEFCRRQIRTFEHTVSKYVRKR